ncbi:MAG TPA: acyltransferase [Terrimicrobiaceae bacterium]
MRKAELPALTGVRFYAALGVYFAHISLVPGVEEFSLRQFFFGLGEVGVSLFFVLSGFILTYNYADRFQNIVRGSDCKRFIWDRLAKIYPLHLATMLYMVPVQVFSPNLPLDWRAVPFHLLLLQCFWPFPRPAFYEYLNVPSWSISCEWFFYLLAPFAIYLALGRVRSRLLVLLAMSYAAGMGLFLWKTHSETARFYYLSCFAPTRFLEFLAGVFLARFFLRFSLPKTNTAARLAQVGGIVWLLAAALYRAHAPWPFWGGLLYIPGSALLIFGLAVGRGFLVSHLSGPWMRRLGMASFSFYLLQAPIIRTIKGICLHLNWQVGSWNTFLVAALGMFVTIQVAALIVYRRYEIPVQNRLRRLFRDSAAPPSTLTEATLTK